MYPSKDHRECFSLKDANIIPNTYNDWYFFADFADAKKHANVKPSNMTDWQESAWNGRKIEAIKDLRVQARAIGLEGGLKWSKDTVEEWMRQNGM